MKQTVIRQILNLFTPVHQSKALMYAKNLPVGRPKREIDLRPEPNQRPPYPDVRRSDVRIEDVTRIVLFDLLKKNLHHFAIHERVGRVVLASYQPHGQYDPVLPVPLMRLGHHFEKNYRNCASVISMWVDAMFSLYYKCERYNNHVGYLHRMPPKPNAVYTEAYSQQIVMYGNKAITWARMSDQWTEEEWEYFHFQMRLSMAHPDRFTDYDDERTRAIWNKAVAYNISLTNH